MEGSVLSPSSWEKRRAWLRQSRQWQIQVLEEEAAAALQDVPEAEPSSLDDVFQEGNPTSKIEDWLQDCGYAEEGFSEEAGQLICNATLLVANDKPFARSFLETARPRQLLDLGCSLASSSMTSGTNKTSSSISQILDKVQEDAEDVLFSLGFGQEDHKDTSRIPARFFTNPSKAKGIDFQLFLKAQVQRIEMEDPCLMLASRFKQVQTLAVTADAFFCLYSYVSKTPVQKFTPSHMFWNCNPTDVPCIKVISPEPEPHSPRERLRKAISKMCLYTCPRDRLSPPHNSSKTNSLDQVVWEVMDRVKGEKLVLQEYSKFSSGPQEEPVPSFRHAKVGTKTQTLDSNLEASCYTHSLPRAYPEWGRDLAEVKRELWDLQTTSEDAYSPKDVTFWKRKSRARKSLFQKDSMVKDIRKVKSLDLSTNQQKWRSNQPDLHRYLSQQLQNPFDLKEMQSNNEEEESHQSSRPIYPYLHEISASNDSKSFLYHHNRTYLDSSDFREDLSSHLFS